MPPPPPPPPPPIALTTAPKQRQLRQQQQQQQRPVQLMGEPGNGPPTGLSRDLPTPPSGFVPVRARPDHARLWCLNKIRSSPQVVGLSQAAFIYSILLIMLIGGGGGGAAPSQPLAATMMMPPQSPPSTMSPRSERQPILEMFNKFFTKARSHDDQQQKEFVREGVIHRLRDLGFEGSFLQKSRFELKHMPAASYNIISIIPGKHRHTKNEKIVLVGAHWDTATKAPGVDDNGSGSTCLLEIARLIAKHHCTFNHTVMLVWFDYEEQGKYGSEFFVNDYLYPYELDKYQSKFIGAYIMDMILVRDKENNTQTLPSNLRFKLVDFFDEVEREKNRGDFLTTWSRKHWDEPLEGVFRSAWTDLGYEARTFKAMRPELPQARMPNADERYEWKDFFRSDHASFWFPPLTSPTVRRAPNRTSAANHSSLNAILLTDLGPWRRSYLKCYHSPCDDEHLLTDGNLSFMQQVVDALVLTLMRTGQGECGQQTKANLQQLDEIESRNSTATTTMMTTTTTTSTPMPTTTTDAATTTAKISVPTTNTSLVL